MKTPLVGDICSMKVRMGPLVVVGKVVALAAISSIFIFAAAAQKNPNSHLQVSQYGERSFPGIRALVRCDTSVLLVTTDDIFLTSNNGASWRELVAPLPHKSVVDVLPIRDTVFVLTSNGMVHRTTNDGLTWNPLRRFTQGSVNQLERTNTGTGALFVQQRGRIASRGYNTINVSDSTLTIRAVHGTEHTITSSSIHDVSGLAVTDSVIFIARSRLPILSIRLSDLEIAEVDMKHLSSEYVSYIQVHNGVLYAGVLAGQGGIHKKPVDGNHWETINIDRNTETVDVQCIVSGDKGVYFGFREHGVAFLPEGAHVAYPIHEGLSGSVAQTVDRYGDDLLITARLRGLIKVLRCGGQVERFSNHLPLSGEYVTGVLGSVVIVGLHWGYVIRTTDNGDHWDTLNIKFPESAMNTIRAYDSTFFICTNDGVWESTNEGATWTRAFAELPQQSIQDIHKIPGGWLVRANEDAYICRNGAKYQVFNPAGSFEHKPHLFDVHADGETIYAAGYPGLFKSTDGGDTWTTYTVADNSIIRSVTVYDSNVYITGLRGQIYYVHTRSLN
jgi:photosystem II stability/assembly factor-like uncharacterized protein